MTANVQKASGYRWLIMVVFGMVTFLVSMGQFQPSFFAVNVMADFGMGTSEFALVTSSTMAVGIPIAFVGGSLADKYGIKKVLLIGLILTTIGAFGRYFAADFGWLLAMSMLMGIAGAIMTANITKLAIAWFPPKQVSLAIAIMLALGTLGIAFAQATTGLMFTDYHQAFLASAIAQAVLTVVWAIVGRDRAISPSEGDEDVEPQKGGVKQVLKSRNLWIAGVACLVYTGFNIVLSGFLITALVTVWGTEPTMAGLIASLATIGAVVGGTALPPIITRSKHAKLLCILIPVVSAALVFIGWNCNVTILRCVFFLLAGCLYGTVNPICMMYPSVLPDIAPQNVGKAGGVITMVMFLGSLIVPSCIVTPIAGNDYNLMVIVDCIVLLIAAVCFVLLPSVSGGKSHAKEQAKDSDGK